MKDAKPGRTRNKKPARAGLVSAYLCWWIPVMSPNMLTTCTTIHHMDSYCTALLPNVNRFYRKIYTDNGDTTAG